MSKLRSRIDYKSLDLELQDALKADELYRLQNDAKLRAIEQNVPTYENFRQMVNAAHLKSLQRADIQSKTKGYWNPIANNDNSSAIMTFDKFKRKQPNNCLKSLNESDNIFEEKIPTTYEQFVQVWKMIKKQEVKFNYLKILRYVLHEKIFRIEIPSTLLVELINTCLQNVSFTDNVEPIVDVLNNLSKCNRFSLAISFMGQNEKEMCSRLFHNLFMSVKCKNKVLEDTIKTLGLIYEVTFE